MRNGVSAMGARHWTTFESAFGHCGLGWGPRGLERLWLAEPERPRLEQRCAALYGADAQRDPPKPLRGLVSRLRRHLAGAPQCFDDVTIDFEGVTPFRRQIYRALRLVAIGEVVTYGQLAGRVGRAEAARAVGGAVARNPVPIVVPCHRVVAAGGKPGGFTAPGGVATKARLLALEGVSLATS